MYSKRFLGFLSILSLLLLSGLAQASSSYVLVDENHVALQGSEIEPHGELMTAVFALNESLHENDKLVGEVVFIRDRSKLGQNEWSVTLQFHTEHSKTKTVRVIGHYEATGDGEGYGYGIQVAEGYWIEGKKRKYVSF